MLATPRELFQEIGGFDTAFVPAYYEDADYCFGVRAKGYRVYYQPESVIVHVEGATSGTDLNAGAKRYQTINRQTFKEKRMYELRRQPEAPASLDLAAAYRLAVREERDEGSRR